MGDKKETKKRHGSSYISRDRNQSYIDQLEEAADTRTQSEKDIDSVFENLDDDVETEKYDD
jgi:hypothetical protein